MPSEVILPRVDMDMATGKISKWLVEPGTTVAKGQPLFEIETDKAAMEIEAPATGTVQTLVEASGQDIPVGSVVAWIYAEGESAAAPAAAGSLEIAPSQSEVDHSTGRAFHGETGVGHPSFSVSEGDRVRATPLARRLARDRKIDLATLSGSGPRGRIQAADVDQATAAIVPPPRSLAGEAQPMSVPESKAAAPRSQATATTPVAALSGGSLNIVSLATA